MTPVFDFVAGASPLLISIPHDGRLIPDKIAAGMTPTGLAMPDTDWHVRELYAFAEELGASVIAANYNRYVVDLNRAADDASLYPGQLVTGLCPEQSFGGEALYRDSSVSESERAERTRRYWRPYHDKIRESLAELESRHGVALLWDAHSIPSAVPRLFDGQLPELNLGSFDDQSCAPDIQSAVVETLDSGQYSRAVNGRFKGGYITRHYGDPENRIHALQLEIAQRAYMDEASNALDESKVAALRDNLKATLTAFIDAGLRSQRKR